MLPEGVRICTVSELTQHIKETLEEAVPAIWVAGEVSNLTRASSGHFYFNLKDAQAQIHAVLWRTAALRVRFEPRDGVEVVAAGRLNVYPQRGEYQLVVQALFPRGLGSQDLALRQLREKLAALGYFDRQRKKPLPRFPRRIALLTSRSGAAVRDMLEILGRRWPVAEIVVCPTPVQGDGAAERMAAAVRFVSRLKNIDVLVLARGGGSSDDLAEFNKEVLAQALFESRIPIVSAIGHEIDVTIADLVADHRALTPSEAAELVAPDGRELAKMLDDRATRMKTLLLRRLHLAQQRWDSISRRRPFAEPLERIRALECLLDQHAERMERAVERCVSHERRRLESIAGRLQNLSPLNVLARGYSITHKESGELVRSAAQVEAGDRLVTRVEGGEIISLVESHLKDLIADGAEVVSQGRKSLDASNDNTQAPEGRK